MVSLCRSGTHQHALAGVDMLVDPFMAIGFPGGAVCRALASDDRFASERRKKKDKRGAAMRAVLERRNKRINRHASTSAHQQSIRE